MSVTILGSAWFSPGFAQAIVAELARAGIGPDSIVVSATALFQPQIGIVLVRVDPSGEEKAYIGLVPGHDLQKDEDLVADWGAHYPAELARKVICTIGGHRLKGAAISPDVRELQVDESRKAAAQTGIYVRARRHGKWVNADIGQLDPASLLAWLRSRGGRNEFAERTVLQLLGHSVQEAPTS